MDLTDYFNGIALLKLSVKLTDNIVYFRNFIQAIHAQTLFGIAKMQVSAGFAVQAYPHAIAVQNIIPATFECFMATRTILFHSYIY